MNPLLSVIDRSTRLGDKTKVEYVRCIQRFIDFAGPTPDTWDGQAVESWRDSLSIAELSATTVNKHLYALRYASKRLEGLGIGRDFARAAETMSVINDRKRRAMDIDDVRAVFETCRHNRPHDIRDRMIMTIALYTGSRSSNLAGLAWGSINGQIAEMVIKGGKRHRAVLNDYCLAELSAWGGWLESVGRSLRGPVLRRVKEKLDGTFVAGVPIRRRQWVNEMLSSRAKKAGIKKTIHPHLFRHTFVTWALENGVAPHRVMMQTGHANMATLSQYVTDLEAEADPVGDHLPEI